MDKSTTDHNLVPPIEPIPHLSGGYTPRSSVPAAQSANTDQGRDIDLKGVLHRRWRTLATITSVLFLAAMIYCWFAPKLYESSASIEIMQPTQSSSGLGAFLSSQMSGLSSIFGGGAGGGADVPTQMEVITSDGNLQQVIDKLRMSETPEELRERINLTPDKLSASIVQLSVRNKSAAKAQAIAQKLIDVYQYQMTTEDATSVGRSELMVQKQLHTAGIKLKKDETELAKYSRRVGSVAPTAENDQRVIALYTLQKDYIDARARYKSEKAQNNYYLKQVDAQSATVVPTITYAQNPRVESAKSQLIQLEAERARLSTEYTSKDEEMVENQNQIDAIRASIVNEHLDQQGLPNIPASGSLAGADQGSSVSLSTITKAQNPIREGARQEVVTTEGEMDADGAQAAALQSAIDTAKSDIASAPSKNQVLLDLTNSALDDQKVVDALTFNVADLDGRRGSEQIYAKVLQLPALPKTIASPKVWLFALASIFLGLLLGTLAMIGIDMADPKVRGQHDVEMLLGLPVLNFVPRLSSDARSNSDMVRIDTVEADNIYKRMACTMAYMGVGRTIRSLVVTSTVMGEGVTFTASHLAVALAKEGQRVILVDANMRRPGLHTFFGMANTDGLAGVMRNGANPEKALVPFGEGQPLLLIPGGSVDREAKLPEVLDSDKITTVIAALADRADVVVIDAPAVFDGMETATLVDKVDGIVFVTGVEHTSRADAERAIELLSSARAPMLGAVVNAAPMRRHK